MIRNVLSFMGSWEAICSKYPEELESIKVAINKYSNICNEDDSSTSSRAKRETWGKKSI